MPSTIITKNGSGAPLAADLVAGELAVDLTNGRLYTDDGSSVIEIGLNPSGNVDVTGTVTADGLTVDASTTTIQKTGDNPILEFKAHAGTQDAVAQITAARSLTSGTNSQFYFKTNDGTSTLNRVGIADNGDISFYEDTGTTAKFFWDASAESLGIGTSVPSQKLMVEGSAGYLTTIQTSDANKPRLQVYIDDTDGVSLVSGYDTTAKGMQFFTGGLNRMRIDSSGRVGIGGTPNTNWRNDIADQAVLQLNTEATFFSDSITTELWNNAYIDNTDVIYNISTRGAGRYQQYQGAHKWWTAASTTAGTNINSELGTTPKMVLDVSGNLLVGKTSTGAATAGIELNGANDLLRIARDGGVLQELNRITNDGDIIEFRKDNTTVGSIGSNSGIYTYIGTDDTTLLFAGNIDTILPRGIAGAQRDAAIDLGNSSNRFKDLYRSGSTIASSDRNMKQDERDLTEAETRVAQACKGLLKAFRFIDAVEVDGDDARIHFGIIAQDLQAAFEAEGLDATKYAMFRPSTFTDEEGNEQVRLGVCYENLLAFIIAAI